MKPFLDSGFLLTLLFRTSGSPTAWQITRNMTGPLYFSAFQRVSVENRLLREMESSETAAAEKGVAAAALQRFRNYLGEQVLVTLPIDYEVAIHLAGQWQLRLSGTTPPFLLLLWPALAVTSGATQFLSFDSRTRRLAKNAGLALLPERL